MKNIRKSQVRKRFSINRQLEQVYRKTAGKCKNKTSGLSTAAGRICRLEESNEAPKNQVGVSDRKYLKRGSIIEKKQSRQTDGAKI